MNKRFAAAIVCGVLATACGRDERPAAPLAPSALPVPALTACPSADAIRQMFRDLFQHRNERTAAESRFNAVLRKLRQGDSTTARSMTLELVRYILHKYETNRLAGGQSQATQDAVAQVINALLCTVGLPQTFGGGALDDDGAVAIVDSTTDTTIVTETQWAGIDIEPGDVTEPTLVTIQRLPDAGPLFTPFDQYPLYYEFSASTTEPLDGAVVVGVCTATSAAPPDPSRLRLAHQVSPTWGDIEVLPLAPVPFLDCAAADVAALPGRSGLLDMASSGGRLLLRAARDLFAPRELLAASYFGTGLGGSVRTFSPFAAIDTLGIADAWSWTVQSGPANQPAPFPPAVHLRTPTGQNMAGVPLTFVVTLGGGSVTASPVGTGADGVAATGWIFGPPGSQRVVATPQGPPGTGFLFVPKIFNATAF
jgi:hypothetical protein